MFFIMGKVTTKKKLSSKGKKKEQRKKAQVGTVEEKYWGERIVGEKIRRR